MIKFKSERAAAIYELLDIARSGSEDVADVVVRIYEAGWRKQSAPAVQGEPAEQYNHKRIGWELERTAMGDGYYGNALRVAKDIPGLTDQDRAVLDRYATGAQRDTDHIALQGLAMRVYTAPQPAEQQPAADGSLTPVPDELFAAEFSAWWEHHGQFCRAGGGDYERTFAFEAWRHLYPKLIEAAANPERVLALLDEIEALQAECEKLREFVERAKTLLEDPIAVFVNMKAGVIAKPSLRDLIDLHGDVPNGEDVQLLEIVKHRAESESLRKLVAECVDYLNHNEHTCIHNGSALHRKLIEAAEKEDSQ